MFTDGFHAQGGPDAAFSELQIEQIRTEISLRRFFEKVWKSSSSTCSGCAADSTGLRSNRPVRPAASPLTAPPEERTSNGWLPNRVEIGHAMVHDTQLTWTGGGLTGTAFEIEPHEGGWRILGQGGNITYGKSCRGWT